MASRFVRTVPNRELVALLEHDPLTHLFPLYLCREAPDAPALIVERGGRVRGALVDGQSEGNRFVPGAWVLAHDPRDAFQLFEAMTPRGRRPEIDFPIVAQDAFGQVFPGVRIEYDGYYRFDRPRPVPVRDVECRELTPDELARLEIPEDLAGVLGDTTTLPERGFFGAVAQGRLVATADVFVDVGSAVTVQQVNTAHECRRQGLARVLVAHVCREMRALGKDVTYLANEANVASVRLAVAVGFVPLARWAWVPAEESGRQA